MNKKIIDYLTLVFFLIIVAVIPATYSHAQNNYRNEYNNAGGGYAVTGQIENVSYSGIIYDATNGLPTSEANYVLCTSNGYVWIASYSGVVRYDGSTFERITDLEGLTSGRGLFQDSRDNIWVGTNDNGVVIIEDGNSRNITYKDGLPSMSIRNFAEDNYNNVYISTTEGLAYADGDFNIHRVTDERLKSKRILRVVASSQGMIYGYTLTGDVFSVVDGSLVQYYSDGSLGIDTITNIYADMSYNGKVYYGTNTGKLYYGEFGKPLTEEDRIDVSPLNKIKWIEKACGRLFVASENQLGYLDENDEFHIIDNLPMNNSIETITSDYQGNLWLASSRQGVMKIVTNNFQNISLQAGIENQVVNTTCLYGDLLYIGTDNGLKIIDDKTRTQVENILTDYFGSEEVRCIQEDTEGNLWIATFSSNLGLVKYSKDGTIKNFTEEDGLPSSKIRNVVIGLDGEILVGSNGGLTVIKDDVIVENYNQREGFTNTVALDVEDGFDGEKLVGTDGDGLFVFLEDETRKYGLEIGLTSEVINKIKRDDERHLYWIITSNSIQYLKDGKIYEVSTFPYNNIIDIFFDDSDNAWVTSSYGIYVVKVDDLLNDTISEYSLYTPANGLTSIPSGRSCMDERGNVYLSGISGVCKFNINSFTDNNAKILVGISNVYCDDVKIFKDADRYTIPSDTGRLVIRPAVLDYSMSNPLVHLYFDDGKDDGITVLRTDLTTLEFTGLQQGTYNLHVQILDNSTKQVLQDQVFTIYKEPNFYEKYHVSFWLMVFGAILVGFIVWFVLRFTIISHQYYAIAEAKDEAERANTAKSRFLANISHEIRTPINTILGMNEILLREDTENVPKPYFMSVVNCSLDIRNAAESLLGLINEILDISKIESGKMHLVEQDYDVVTKLRSIVSMIKVKGNEKDLTFDMNIDENIPKVLYGDGGKIKQIILNLLTNAVKYTEQGGFTLSVMLLGIEGKKANFKVSVKDTGIGVKEEDLDKLFTAYERLDEERNSAIQGTGLGLDISRRFSELLGGKLWCESVYGKGSEFIFTFSQTVVDPTPIGKFTEHDESEAKFYRPQFIAPNGQVLVVDDNQMNLNVFKGLLKATKVRITTASSGQECLDLLKEHFYHVVLLDHMMPTMDGIETLEKIRQFNTTVPVYALTANNKEDAEEFYKSKGFDGFLAKPINSQILEATLKKHLTDVIEEVPEDDFESEEELTDLPEEMSWVKEIASISVEEGVKNSGSVEIYMHSLKDFYDTIDYNISTLKKALEDDDIKLYTVKVHSLKTSARIIGDMKLSSLAQQLEEAGKKSDLDFIQMENVTLLTMYSEYKDKLARIVYNGYEVEDDRPQISADDLKDAYNALSELVPQMDYDSVEMIINQVKEYKLPEVDAKKFQEFEKLLKLFDWDKMEELLK